MKHFTTLTASLLAAATVAGGLALPSQASAQRRMEQTWTPERAAMIRNQINGLANDINRADRRNTISNREARGLHRSVQTLRSQFRNYNRNGLTRREVQYLQTRANNIRVRLRMERFDWDNRRR